jgi:hypothetical protein
MSQRSEEIKRKIAEMFQGNDQVFQATVKDVNEDEFTCTVIFDDELEYTDVRLRAVIDSEKKGFCFIPAVDSIVQVGRLANSDQLYIALFSEIDKYLLSTGDTIWILDQDQLKILKGENEDIKMLLDAAIIELSVKEKGVKIDKNGLVFNGGAKNSFMIDINKDVQKKNTVENDLNTLKQLVTTWVPAPMDGGAVLKGLLTSWASQTITPTTVNDLKDELIKH